MRAPEMVVTGWLAHREREGVDYLIGEDRCLRRQPGTRRVRLSDGRGRSNLGLLTDLVGAATVDAGTVGVSGCALRINSAATVGEVKR